MATGAACVGAHGRIRRPIQTPVLQLSVIALLHRGLLHPKGCGIQENGLGELKQHLAFDTIPTNDWDANTTWQLITALTHNLVRQFQITTTAATRKNGRAPTAGCSSPFATNS